MRPASRSTPIVRPGLPATLFAALLVLAVLAGGASFPDTLGQPVMRVGAIWLVAIAIGVGVAFDWSHYRIPIAILAAAVILVVLQLVPLPPGLWRILPGRSAFDLSVLGPSVANAWRPAAIVPDAAWNALFALAVPVAALALLTATPRPQLLLAVPLLLALVGLSSVVAALQFAGGAFDNPLINERTGFASGLLANRNHQALFLAIGIAAALYWGSTRPFMTWRAVMGGMMAAWFTLMILATGSRAGLLLGAMALIGGGLLVMAALRHARWRLPRGVMIGAAAAAVAAIAGIIALSIYAGRSETITRLNEAVVSEDMRVRAFPVVIDMVRTYLPIGGGQGSFATLFRTVEPESLLKPTYYNHAHNDLIEVMIEAGVPGAILLLLALAWAGARGVEAWRAPPGDEVFRARLGSLIILLVVIASVADYPARTPLIMVVLILATGWISRERAHPVGFTR